MIEYGALIHAIAAPRSRQANDGHSSLKAFQQCALIVCKPNPRVHRIPAFALKRVGEPIEEFVITLGLSEYAHPIHKVVPFSGVGVRSSQDRRDDSTLEPSPRNYKNETKNERAASPIARSNAPDRHLTYMKIYILE